MRWKPHVRFGGRTGETDLPRCRNCAPVRSHVLLRRFYVLLFIDLDTCRVHLPGVTANPTSQWVTQQARNLSFERAERSRPVKFLIRDRDTSSPPASTKSSAPTASRY